MRDLRLEGLAEQQLVEGAFELAAASGHGAGDMRQDFLRYVQRRVFGLGMLQAQLQHGKPHRVVGRRHFQRDAAIEARAHARLEQFQFGRRPVGRHHHLLGAVEQHVDQVAELVLDGLALQELHVVDDQQVDVAQLFFQRQRVVVADRGGEAPHEIFRGQVDDARLRVLLEQFRGDGLQQMRLAEPDRGMQEERIEARIRRLFGDRARRREGNAVGRPLR